MMRKLQMIVLDGFLILATYTLVVAIFRVIGLTVFISDALFFFLPILVIKLVLYSIFGLYKILAAHVGFEDLMKIILVVTITNVVVMGIFLSFSIDFIHPFALIFITPIEITALAFPRVIRKLLLFVKNHILLQPGHGKRTLIIGAGDGGEMVLKESYRNKALNNTIVAFVDDDRSKIGKELLGIKIVGPIDAIESFIHEYNIEEVIIAIANISLKRLKNLVEIVSQNDVKIKRLPLIHEMDEDRPQKIIDVKVEDLLDRDEITLDIKGIESFIKDEVILITGGGGSIGSELARQAARFEPKQLIIFDIYENNAYEIQMELERYKRKHKLTFKLETIIGSVSDEERIKEIFALFKPTLLFHAAAYKHVPLMETSPKEAVRTNILGTYYVAKACQDFEVKNMVLVSSDKAVRPTNIMGATKRYAELIVAKLDQQTKTTKYASVRFGNVLGSNGSVIPLFKKQIEEGGPLTVTHPDITRYFMTIPEAVGLILECAQYSKGGEIFVLDMGDAIKIKDLAEKMIRLAGLQPKRDIDIIYTGLRPGEKLFEELLVDNKKDKTKTANQKILIESKAINGDKIDLEAMFSCMKTCTTNDIKAEVAKQIHSYKIQTPKH